MTFDRATGAPALDGAGSTLRMRMARLVSPLLLHLALICGVLAASGAWSGVQSAEPITPRNLERLERCAAGAADSLLDALDVNDTICVAVVAHDAGWLLESALVERATARGIAVLRCDRSDARRVDVAITTIGVVYRRIDEGIERVASLSLSAGSAAPIAESGTAGPLRSHRIAAALTDTLAAADTSGLSDAAYPYTVGTVISADGGGFWRTIVEPAVVLAASAIVAILLFTVRSQ